MADPWRIMRTAAEAKLSRQQRWQIERARSARLLARAGTFDEAEHPRDEHGRWTDSGGGGTSATSGKPAGPATSATSPSSASTQGGKKKPVSDEDFKAKVKLSGSMTDNQKDKFFETWNAKVPDADPEEFRREFMGGLDGTMQIGIDGSSWRMQGEIQDEKGNKLGHYTRTINFDKNVARSDLLEIKEEYQSHGIAKKLLAGNVAKYQELGLKKLEVTAGLTVGGHAWAKYGYVPTQSSWNALRSELARKVRSGSGSSGSGYKPESWDDLSSDQQDEIERAFMDDTINEFVESEISSWRDSGQALEETKRSIADNYRSSDTMPEWTVDAFAAVREAREKNGDKPIPFTDLQLFEALEMEEYSSRYDDGRSDPEFTWDDSKLDAPEGFVPEQTTLPGIEPRDPASYLTADMREQIVDELTDQFNRKAERDEADIEPPDYIRDSANESQSDYWGQLDDSDRYRWAEQHGHLPDIEEEPAPDEEIDDDDTRSLLHLINSNDPKAIWAIADSSHGKDLLLKTSWSGALDFSDKETMDRFNAYVAKRKAA